MKKEKLISLAMNFASFLVERVKVDRIILFGSVASGNFDKESDIDLFVESDKRNKKKIESLLELYKKSKEYEKYKLDGIEKEISVKSGKLSEWKGLERSIISNGILLYGRYIGKADKLEQRVLFVVDFGKRTKAEKIKIWRKVYGYKQKVGKKVYTSEGLAERKLGRGAFIVSLENAVKVKSILLKNRVKYEVIEVWFG
jgi:predicted nucleotidyltransferase